MWIGRAIASRPLCPIRGLALWPPGRKKERKKERSQWPPSAFLEHTVHGVSGPMMSLSPSLPRATQAAAATEEAIIKLKMCPIEGVSVRGSKNWVDGTHPPHTSDRTNNRRHLLAVISDGTIYIYGLRDMLTLGGRLDSWKGPIGWLARTQVFRLARRYVFLLLFFSFSSSSSSCYSRYCS